MAAFRGRISVALVSLTSFLKTKGIKVFLIYDAVFLVAGVLYFPYLIWKGKWHKGFMNRFGMIPAGLKNACHRRKNIWIHAVSVGEVLAIADLIDRLRASLPDYQIVCSTVTKTGQKVAHENLNGKAVVFYAPLDFSWVVRKYVKLIDPKIYISAETEIWPNLYTFLRKRSVPVVQINGRISDKSFKGYRRVSFFTKRILACVSAFYMQSELDAQRIMQLGAPTEKVRVFGNLKFDNLPDTITVRADQYGFSSKDELLIAGSTHPGEEEAMLVIYKVLRKDFPRLRLVLCPRHVERAKEVSRTVEAQGFQAVLLSKLTRPLSDKAVLVVDSVGKLRSLYGLAKLVFVGKSLTASGGQNMIEPAFFAKPIFVGPHTYNFKDVMNIFLKEHAIVQVNTQEELLEEMRDVLNNSVRMYSLGNAAKRIVTLYQGATTNTVAAIKDILS